MIIISWSINNHNTNLCKLAKSCNGDGLCFMYTNSGCPAIRHRPEIRIGQSKNIQRVYQKFICFYCIFLNFIKVFWFNILTTTSACGLWIFYYYFQKCVVFLFILIYNTIRKRGSTLQMEPHLRPLINYLYSPHRSPLVPPSGYTFVCINRVASSGFCP